MLSFPDHLHSLDQSKQDIYRWRAFFSSVPTKERILFLNVCFYPKKYKIISPITLKKWVVEFTCMPEWLVEITYDVVKDNTENLSLLLPRKEEGVELDVVSFIAKLEQLMDAPMEMKKAFVWDNWQNLEYDHLLLFNRLITGVHVKEINKSTLIEALSQELELDISWIKYCLHVRLKNVKDSISLFEMNELDYELRPLFFSELKETVQVASLENNSLSPYYAGLRVQIVSNGHKVLVWSEQGEIEVKYQNILSALEENRQEKFVLHGEMIQEMESYFFNLWWIENAEKRVQEKIENYFKKQDLNFESIEEYQHFSNSLSSTKNAGIISWDANKKIAQLIRSERIVFKAVIVYAQMGTLNGTKTIEQVAVGLKKGEEIITVGKTKLSDLPAQERNELSAWIVKNKLERIGPILIIPPAFVGEVSCAAITPSKRHKCGYSLQDVRLYSVVFCPENLLFDELSRFDIFLPNAK